MRDDECQHKIIFGAFLCRVLLAGSLITVAGCSKPDMVAPEKTLAPVVTAPQREAILPILPDGYVTVMRGETLYTIAARYQVSPLAIIEDNQLEAPFIMAGAGQQLKLTPPRFHMVFPGDSSSSIVKRYGISEEQLATANGSRVPMKLVIGQRLVLPAEPDFASLGTASQSETETAQSAAQATTAPTPPRKQFVAPTTGGPFMWPVEAEAITEFGPAARGVHNDGINIAAVAGADVLASAAGTVAFIGREIKLFGTLVLVTQGWGDHRLCASRQRASQ